MNGCSSRRIFRTARKMLCFVALVFSPSIRAISSIDSPSKWRSVKAARSISVSSAIAPASRSLILDAQQRSLGRRLPVAGRAGGALQGLGLLGHFALRPRAQQIHGAVGGNAMQPRPEVRPRLEPVQLPIGPEERLLHDVFGVLDPSRDAVRHAEHGAAVPLHQFPEGVVIARADAGDGLGIDLQHPFRLDAEGRGRLAGGPVLVWRPRAARAVAAAPRAGGCYAALARRAAPRAAPVVRRPRAGRAVASRLSRLWRSRRRPRRACR